MCSPCSTRYTVHADLSDARTELRETPTASSSAWRHPPCIRLRSHWSAWLGSKIFDRLLPRARYPPTHPLHIHPIAP